MSATRNRRYDTARGISVIPPVHAAALRTPRALVAMLGCAVSLSLPAVEPAAVGASFLYHFHVPGVLEETGSSGETSSPYWWLNSGAQMPIEQGRGHTLQGKLPYYSRWRLLYSLNNPVDTDGGYRPQNIFRLVGRSVWADFTQRIHYRIQRINQSDSPNRNASNGVLLFNRYQDGDNLYYAGLRVDGKAVIKKKKDGIYHTMAQKQVFAGRYHRADRPNLLPIDDWRGLRADVRTLADGRVRIDLYEDKGWTGKWWHLLTAVDDATNFGGAPITASGFGGLRLDFMDVVFDNYRIARL